MKSLSLARDGSKEDSYTTLNDSQLLLLASHDQPSRVKANTKIQAIDLELYLEGAFLFVFERTYDALSVRLGCVVTMFAPSNQRIDSPVKQAKERVAAPCPRQRGQQCRLEPGIRPDRADYPWSPGVSKLDYPWNWSQGSAGTTGRKIQKKTNISSDA